MWRDTSGNQWGKESALEQTRVAYKPQGLSRRNDWIIRLKGDERLRVGQLEDPRPVPCGAGCNRDCRSTRPVPYHGGV